MEKTNLNTRGVSALTSLARLTNPIIGTYQEHFINEDFGFTVRLSNGAIRMSKEVAEDYELQPSSVTQDRIDKIANTYRKI
jgi:hypothetical protein